MIGLSLARELAGDGVEDVVLIEHLGAPGRGSTAKANGGIRAQFTTRSNIEFSLYTIHELEKLQRDTDGLPGFIQAGYLLFTGTEQGEAGLRTGYELQRECGVDVEWLSPAEVLAKAPFVRGDGLRAGTFHERDGLIDPHGVVQAMWDQVKATSVDLLFDHEVTSIDMDPTPSSLIVRGPGPGTIKLEAEWVVNAAGPDAKDVAALCGVDLPCEPVRRNLACTDPVSGYPAVIPMCVDLDTGVLIRRESAGFLIAYSNPDDLPGTDTSLDPNFLSELAERIGNRFPFLEDAGIHERGCWAGLYPETPDHHAIVGPTPGLPRLLHSVGFGGHGIMHSIAAARALADYVQFGESRVLDIGPLRLERFAEGDLIVESAVL